MSCRETAAPWLIRYGVAHLLSCAATSMIDRGRRLTDEAFRTRVGKLSAGSSGWLFHVFAPVWHSGALLRASNRRGRASRVSIPARTLIGLGPQSKRFFACLNCARLMTGASWPKPCQERSRHAR
jgi:hypothetical protein